jgi:quinol monooxygenase YgiN
MTRIDSETITVLATFVPKVGMEEAVQSVLQEVLEPTRQEPGCLRFDLFRSTGTPTTFNLYEIFSERASIDARRLTHHYQAYRAKIEPLLETAPCAVVVSPIDVVSH